MSGIKEFRAKLCFLQPEEGGRKAPVFSGYRPPVYFGLHGRDGEKLYNDCLITLEGRDQVSPGEECYARIRPYHPELLQDVLKPNVSFEVAEGARVVGKGTIIKVFKDGR